MTTTTKRLERLEARGGASASAASAALCTLLGIDARELEELTVEEISALVARLGGEDEAGHGSLAFSRECACAPCTNRRFAEYALHGTPDGACPTCGLVDQHVEGSMPHDGQRWPYPPEVVARNTEV